MSYDLLFLLINIIYMLILYIYICLSRCEAAGFSAPLHGALHIGSSFPKTQYPCGFLHGFHRALHSPLHIALHNPLQQPLHFALQHRLCFVTFPVTFCYICFKLPVQFIQHDVSVRQATISLSLLLTCASRCKPWAPLWSSPATTPLVVFHHRLTACPSYKKTGSPAMGTACP